MSNTLLRLSPETDFTRGRFDRLFHQMLGSAPSLVGGDVCGAIPAKDAVAGRNFVPAVDVKSGNEALTFVFELPGLNRENVEITVENNVLTVAGERKFEVEVNGETYHRIERGFGSFSRSFTLPTGIRTDKVDASFQEGILTVVLPKEEETKPRKITIR